MVLIMSPVSLAAWWRLAALTIELLLMGTHIKVLLCVGKPYSSQELSGKRWSYFLLDLVSPWNALAAVLGGSLKNTFAAGAMPLLVLLAFGHACLHLFYILTWHNRHASNVIQMSAVSDMRSRWRRFNAAEVVWFLTGTSYDILTHTAIAGLLVYQLGWSQL